jgi:phosphoglycolate phosphatase-like HAD superfamily hydrolase
MMGAPVAVFFANELPMYFGTVNAYSQASAILGDTAPEAMANMSSVSFTDKDIFLPGDSVRIKGVKVIDNNRIDNIIYYATSALELIGGPLAKTFKQASLDNVSPESAELRLVSENGIDAVIDGKHIVLGTYNFMDVQCFNPVKEANDHHWEGKTHKRMLYLACDEKIIAKFYIEYNVNPEFVSIVKRLAKAGICVAIRTNDPCVDSDLFYKNKIALENTFKVIKGITTSDEIESVYAGKAGAVSAGSIKGLVKTVVACDRVRNVQKTNFVLKIVATVIGLLGMGFIIATGVSFGMLWSIYFALYQLLWLVPVYIVSKVNI